MFCHLRIMVADVANRGLDITYISYTVRSKSFTTDFLKIEDIYWCRIHLWFRLMGGSASKVDDVTALPSCHKMADVTMATLWQQQDGGYALLFYIFNSTVIDRTFFFKFKISSIVSQIIKGIQVKHNKFIMEYRFKWLTTFFGLFTLLRPSSGQAGNLKEEFTKLQSAYCYRQRQM